MISWRVEISKERVVINGLKFKIVLLLSSLWKKTANSTEAINVKGCENQ